MKMPKVEHIVIGLVVLIVITYVRTMAVDAGKRAAKATERRMGWQ